MTATWKRNVCLFHSSQDDAHSILYTLTGCKYMIVVFFGVCYLRTMSSFVKTVRSLCNLLNCYEKPVE